VIEAAMMGAKAVIAKGLGGKSLPTIPVVPGSADLIPDSAGKNSRLGTLRELAHKRMIWLVLLTPEGRLYRANR
jgi:hypothetical protein